MITGAAVMARWCFPLILICFLAGVYPPFSAAAEKMNVAVSIAPQKYFVEAIAGDVVTVTVIVSPDRSPADYEPTPAQMRQLSKADIYFAIGVPFEAAWLDKFAAINPDMRIVHTDTGIKKQPIDRYEIAHRTDLSGKNHSHDHGILDPHIWLSPPLVKLQAAHYQEALAQIDPEHREFYQDNYSAFITQIDRLDTDLKSLFDGTTGRRKFLVFHPSWGYFADAYGLTQISIEIEGKSPKAREVKNLIVFAQNHQIESIFVQPQFSTRQAEIVAGEIGGRLVVADPTAENWEQNLRSVARAFKMSLE